MPRTPPPRKSKSPSPAAASTAAPASVLPRAVRPPFPYQLGKRHPRIDPRTLQFAAYLKPAKLPAAPAAIDYAGKLVSWGMMANDRIGDCTCAAAGHLIEQWTTYGQGPVVVPTDKQVIAAYAAITGYDPVTGAHDDGAVELDVLNYWRRKGIARNKIYGYAAVELHSHSQVQDSVFLFSNCYIGIALPLSAQSQSVWSVPPGGPTGDGTPGSWGGHAVPIVGYSVRDLTVVTWGATKHMTWQFLDTYCDEAYAVLGPQWINRATNTAPPGFDLAALEADLMQI